MEYYQSLEMIEKQLPTLRTCPQLGSFTADWTNLVTDQSFQDHKLRHTTDGEDVPKDVQWIAKHLDSLVEKNGREVRFAY